MNHRSRETKDARTIEKAYGTKAAGVKHMTVLRLVTERGLEGAIEQLEAWGLSPTAPPASQEAS